MPQKPINYDNTMFYKLVCKDLNIGECYVGHTTDFKRRKHEHKIHCNNDMAKGYHRYVYNYIRSNGGWDNWDLILIENRKCDNKLDALKKEREHIEILHATLNKVIPTRTDQEYKIQNKLCKETHKDKIKEKMQHYRDEHKDKIKEQNKIYKDEHKDKIKEQMQHYRENNKDAIKEYRKQICVCSCGASYTFMHKARHEKSNKHLNHINSNSQSTEDASQTIT